MDGPFFVRVAGKSIDDLTLLKLRAKVMKYLEKNSIQWTEKEPNSGNILIRINQGQDRHG
jgi:hypothetical protein